MDAKIYFPQVDLSRPERTELRSCIASLEAGGTDGASITSTPSQGRLNQEEKTQATRAINAVRAWERGVGETAYDSTSVSMILDSEFLSEGSSGQLAIAAADWLARRPGAKPKQHLVATGMLPELHAIQAKGGLAVLPVSLVLEKARLVLADLKSDKLKGAPVLFCFPAANAGDAGLAEVLRAFPAERATYLPVKDFAELIKAWVPDAPKPSTTFKRPRLVPTLLFASAVVVGALFAVPSGTAAGVQWLGSRVETAMSYWTVKADLRSLSNSAALQPDHPSTGCDALLQASPRAPDAPAARGWRKVDASLAACRALSTCDLNAASPRERPQGRLLSQLASDRDRLETTRLACAQAEAAFPNIARIPYQLGRTLLAGGEAARTDEIRVARARAEELGHPLALAEGLMRQVHQEPELARMRLAAIMQRPDPHPEVQRALAELLACGMLQANRTNRPVPPSMSDLQQAANLLRSAAASPLATRMSGNEAHNLERQAQTLRDIIASEAPRAPTWCADVAVLVASR